MDMPESVEKLLEDNLKLANFVAKSYLDCGIEEEDIKSIAKLGLLKAAYRYEPEKGYAFSTFAVRVMQNTIMHELRKSRAVIRKADRQAVSLDAPLPFDTGYATLQDIIPDRDSCFEEKIEERNLLDATITDILNVCPSKHCIALLLTALGINQTDIANIFGVSQSAVSKVLLRAKEAIGGVQAQKSQSNNSMTFMTNDSEYQLVINETQHCKWSLLHMLQKAKELKCHITISEKEVVIRMPRDERAFKFLVMLINELEEYDYDVDTLLNKEATI